MAAKRDILDRLTKAKKQIEDLEGELLKDIQKRRDALLAQLKALDDEEVEITGVPKVSRKRGGRGVRKGSVQEGVYNAIKAGATNRQALISKLGITDKPGEQSLSNALTALKKSGRIKAGKQRGAYVAV